MADHIDKRSTVVHVIFRLDYGGLENGVVNVLRGLTQMKHRHVVVALTEATDFAKRLPNGVDVYSIGKQPGKDPGAYLRLFRLFRRIRPDVVHTRNIGTLDCAFIAFLARVPVRLHGEHGWDIFDPDGKNARYRWIRRVMSLYVHKFVTVSDELANWLINTVGIPERKVDRLRNGVDTQRFRPTAGSAVDVLPKRFHDRDKLVIGSVTRFSAIKDPVNLVKAFKVLATEEENLSVTPLLVMIGSGELHNAARAALADAGLTDRSWLPGARDDIPELMGAMDIFVLGSLREGISNTVLEAMASGLPVVACDTGGNPELISDSVNGFLVPPGDSAALADAIRRYIVSPELRQRHGSESRRRAEREFSLDFMIERYRRLYDSAIEKATA